MRNTNFINDMICRNEFKDAAGELVKLPAAEVARFTLNFILAGLTPDSRLHREQKMAKVIFWMHRLELVAA